MDDFICSRADLNSGIFSFGMSLVISKKDRVSVGLSFWRGWFSGMAVFLSGLNSRRSFGVQESAMQSFSTLSRVSDVKRELAIL